MLQVVLRDVSLMYFSVYQEMLAYQQTDFSMSLSNSLSLSMSMSFGYEGTQILVDGSNSLQPVLIGSTVITSAPTDKVTTPSVESGGVVDVNTREVVEKAAMNAGVLSGKRNDDGNGDHPIIFVVLSIAVGTVLAVVAVRKIGGARRCHAKNMNSDLSQSVTEGSV